MLSELLSELFRIMSQVIFTELALLSPSRLIRKIIYGTPFKDNWSGKIKRFLFPILDIIFMASILIIIISMF